VPADFDNGEGNPCLIILDDLLNDVYSKDVCDIFTIENHHRNISVIVFTQNLFHQGRYCRDISLNAKYIVPLKNVRDKNQFVHLARTIYPQEFDGMYRPYLNANERPLGYVLLDLLQDTNDRLRFRNYIFLSEYPPALYTDTDDESDKVELPRSSHTQVGLAKCA
jgi:hypothetical protein